MAEPAAAESLAATLTLTRSRALVRSSLGRLVGLTAAIAYLFLALLFSSMLVFGPSDTTGISVSYLRWGIPWWDFPMVVVVAPNAVLALPLFSVVTMAIVAAGVGLGMAVAVRLAVELYRRSRRRVSSPTALASVTGLTPALLALVTLGACCSTTAAATASIGVVAQATGQQPDQLLANAWYLSIFQIGILWLSLVAQERLVTIYAAIAGPPAESDRARAPATSPPRVALRAWVAAAGAVWLLTVVATWTGVDAWTAGAGSWALWLGVGILPAVAAIGLAVFPQELARPLTTPAGRLAGPLARGALGALGAFALVGAVVTPVGGAGLALGPLGAPSGLARLLLELLPIVGVLAAFAVAPARLVRALGEAAAPAGAASPPWPAGAGVPPSTGRPEEA